MIPFLRHAPALAAIPLIFADAASAREVTAAERDALAERVAGFQLAATAGDAEAMVDVLPPLILPAIAEQAGIPLAELRAQLAADELMAMVTEFWFEVDVAATRYFDLADGTPYGLIPTETFVRMDTTAVRSATETLAVLLDGEWYLVRIDEEPQVAMLRTVYPLFAEIVFPDPVVELIGP
ncbi:MAG: hypothetical protein AB7O56_07190 [Bauldia sp.]